MLPWHCCAVVNVLYVFLLVCCYAVVRVFWVVATALHTTSVVALSYTLQARVF